ncbi:MAG TPA: hypothetical protein VEG29_01030 [Candidatus Binatia bacterium]|nr:hypothetical protein [Candidatus Binatia bacterium]
MNGLRRFGAFWYDFLVGDRPELFIGPIVVLVVVWASVALGVPGVVSAGIMVVGIVAVGGLSLVLQTRPRH